jgi:para-nitrobenzyl esterase
VTGLTKIRARVAVALLALCASGLVFAAHAQPVAYPASGEVTGIVADDMQAFLGIRYAAPPTGLLRWQPPQPVPQNLVTHQATAFGPHCPQPASAYGVASDTEDCLYLNVFRPNTTYTQTSPKLPVMVWIHGGALVTGESDSYKPVKLVNDGNIIVVTINYRLGYFGFLATAGLDAEGHVAVNYGLQDQQYALAWVQANIAAFGGDPSRVTIAGESAGGLSVLSNLVSPTAAGMFAAAIVESGGYALQLPSLREDETIGAGIAAALGCAPTDTACLRNATTDQIVALDGAAGLSVLPGLDGKTLRESINTALSRGQFAHVPILNGTNHDEYRQFLPSYAGLPGAAYPSVLDGIFGQVLGPAVAAEYPLADYTLPVYGLAAAVSDEVFICPARQIDLWTSLYAPTFAYEFNDREAPEDFLAPVPGYVFGASHASELQFLFVPTPPEVAPRLTFVEQALSAVMVRYWTNFVNAYSPDSVSVPYWPNFAVDADNFQSLLPPSAMQKTNFARVHHCAFWTPVIDPS